MILQSTDAVIDKFVRKLTITPRGEKGVPHKRASKKVRALFKQKIIEIIVKSPNKQHIFEYTEDGDKYQYSFDLFDSMETLPTRDDQYHLPSGISMIVIKDDNGEVRAWTNLD